MEQRTLVRWLKILVIFASVCGIAICVGILPMVGKRMIEVYPEFSYCYHPWLIFLWILAVPCFIALVLAWKIFKNIEEDHSFCMEMRMLFGRFLFWQQPIQRFCLSEMCCFFC